MKFGECLKLLLSTLGVSMNQLSKAINVDNSLVNRWIHDKRVPMYNTPYIERISGYLSKNVNNTFQMQHLNKIFMDICENISSEDSIEEKIRKVLSETQGYSIECKKKEKISNGPNKDNLSNKLSDDLPYNPSNCIGLSNEDKIIIGKSNVLSAGMHLLKTASQNCGSGNAIYISLINDINISFQYPDLVYFREIISKAINCGWNIILFIRISNNINRIIELINFAKPLIKTGKFHPYYLKRYDVSSTGKENLCIPGIGALSCFLTNPLSGMDCAFYFKTEVAIDIIKNYFNVLLSTCAQPIFNYYPENDYFKYNHYVIENEESIGNRTLYKYCFSLLTIPKNLYIKILNKMGLSRNEIFASQEYYDRRLKAFLSNVENYEYKDIYCYDSVVQLIKHQQFFIYYHMGVRPVNLEVKDVIEILNNVISLLKRYKNYNIAFNNKYPNYISKDYISEGNEFYCMVKERQAVLLEAYEPSKNMPLMRLSIEEPMVVKACQEYFNEKWEHIAPINKDKNEVINWIQEQIKLLEKKMKIS